MKKIHILMSLFFTSGLFAQNFQIIEPNEQFLETDSSKKALMEAILLQTRSDSFKFIESIREKYDKILSDSYNDIDTNSEYTTDMEWKETLQNIKNIFLCTCIYSGFRGDSAFSEGSPFLLDASLGAFIALNDAMLNNGKISVIIDLGKRIGKSTPVNSGTGNPEELLPVGKKQILQRCLFYYQSKVLDDIVIECFKQ